VELHAPASEHTRSAAVENTPQNEPFRRLPVGGPIHGTIVEAFLRVSWGVVIPTPLTQREAALPARVAELAAAAARRSRELY
jgi:hypothetical protein